MYGKIVQGKIEICYDLSQVLFCQPPKYSRSNVLWNFAGKFQFVNGPLMLRSCLVLYHTLVNTSSCNVMGLEFTI